MIFDSLAAFRAHCGEPTMPLERCSICSAIPERCSRETVSSLVADYDVDYGDEGRGHNNVPAQVEQLETLVAGPEDDALLRCPPCHRLYLRTHELVFVGARNYSTWSYGRVDVDALFRTAWGVSRRLSDRDVEAIHPHAFFPHHAIVRFRAIRAWFSLDDANQLAELNAETLRRVVAADPPTGLDEPTRARRYAEFISEVEDPDVQIVDSLGAIRWRESLTDDERDQVDAARAASRIAAPAAERAGDEIVVRLWIVSQKRLICRIVTVRRTGDAIREDAVIAENLPVAPS